MVRAANRVRVEANPHLSRDCLCGLAVAEFLDSYRICNGNADRSLLESVQTGLRVPVAMFVRLAFIFFQLVGRYSQNSVI